MAEGVVLKLSTEAAVKSQQDLQSATKAATDTLAQQSKVVAGVESAQKSIAATQQQAAVAVVQASKATDQANAKIVNLGRSTSGAIPFVTKLTQAVGGSSGAARALGIFGDSARLLAGALNPVGIAIGLASSAIIGFVANLVAAESPLEKTARLAKEAQLGFDLIGESANRASTAIQSAAEATSALNASGSVEQQLSRAKAQLDALRALERSNDLADARGSAPLTLPDIAALAQAIGKSEQVIQALGRLATATGQEYDKALAVVRAAGIDIAGDRQVENPLLFQNLLRSGQPTEPALSRQGTPTLGRGQVEALIAAALGGATNRVRDLQRQSFEEANRKRAEDRADKDQAAGARALNEERQAAIAFERTSASLRGQSEFLRASSAERERLIREARISREQQSAGVLPGTAEADQIRAAVEEIDKLEQAENSIRQFKELGRDAFDTVANSIAQAALEGKNLRQTLASVGNNLSSLLLSRAIGAASNSIFGPAPGGNGMLGRVLPMRSMMAGGVLDRSQTIVSGGYAINVAEGGGASPEAILPLGRDQFGRLGVRGEGGGGGTVILNLPNVRTGEQARQVRPTLAQTVESVQRRGRRTLRAGR